jgi:hypothetical protein
MHEKLSTSFLLKVFWNEDASVVKTAVFFQVAPVCQYGLTAAWLMFKKSQLFDRLLYQGV